MVLQDQVSSAAIERAAGEPAAAKSYFAEQKEYWGWVAFQIAFFVEVDAVLTAVAFAEVLVDLIG